MADTLDARFGRPSADCTHWQIYRIGATGPAILSYPDAENVMLERWPIAELTMQTIRDRWGHGRFHIRWYSTNQEKGNGVRGKSPDFELGTAPDEESEAAPKSDFAHFLAMQRQAKEEASRETDRVLALAREFMGGRPGAAAAASPESEELRAMRTELQEMRTREAARAAADAVRAELRADLEASNRRIAELERENERGDEGPSLDLESPIMSQIVGFVVSAAMKNPDAITGLIGNILEKVATAKAAAPPAPVHNPAQMPAQAAPNVSRETSPVAPLRPVVVPFPKRQEVAPAPRPVVVVDEHPYGKPEPIEAVPSAPEARSGLADPS